MLHDHVITSDLGKKEKKKESKEPVDCQGK